MSPNGTFLKGNFRGLQHLGIPVANLQVSVDFYSRLGFESILSSRVDVPEEHDAILVAMMKQKEIIIELYQVTEIEQKELRSRHDGHVDHIAFDVADVDKAFLELRQADVEILQKEPMLLNFWDKGCKYFTIRGPDGEKLEFNQIL
jgi:lactoylglutathione lyase